MFRPGLGSRREGVFYSYDGILWQICDGFQSYIVDGVQRLRVQLASSTPRSPAHSATSVHQLYLSPSRGLFSTSIKGIFGDGYLSPGEAVNVATGVDLPAGEANLMANVGAGAGIYRDKVGVTFNARTLVGTGGITATVVADTVAIDGSAISGGSAGRDVDTSVVVTQTQLTTSYQSINISGTPVEVQLANPDNTRRYGVHGAVPVQVAYVTTAFAGDDIDIAVQLEYNNDGSWVTVHEGSYPLSWDVPESTPDLVSVGILSGSLPIDFPLTLGTAIPTTAMPDGATQVAARIQVRQGDGFTGPIIYIGGGAANGKTFYLWLKERPAL